MLLFSSRFCSFVYLLFSSEFLAMTTISSSLFNLTSRFEEIEGSMCDLMLETVLKLSALTQSRVFLCVESASSSPKRRICGSGDMLDSFVAGSMRPCDADVIVELAASTFRLRERPLSNGTTKGKQKRSWADNYPLTPVEDQDWQPSASKKKAQGFPVESPQTPFDPWTTHLEVDERVGGAARFGAGVEIVVAAKREIEELVIDDDAQLGDGVVEIKCGVVSNSSVNAGLDSLTNDAVESLAVLSDRRAAKILALQSITDPWLAFRKGSAENRIFASVFYDFGKSFALENHDDPDPMGNRSREIFFQHLNEFVKRNFTRFVLDRRVGNPIVGTEEDCLKSYSALGFMRKIARTGFMTVIKRLEEKRSKGKTRTSSSSSR